MAVTPDEGVALDRTGAKSESRTVTGIPGAFLYIFFPQSPFDASGHAIILSLLDRGCKGRIGDHRSPNVTGRRVRKILRGKERPPEEKSPSLAQGPCKGPPEAMWRPRDAQYDPPERRLVTTRRPLRPSRCFHPRLAASHRVLCELLWCAPRRGKRAYGGAGASARPPWRGLHALQTYTSGSGRPGTRCAGGLPPRAGGAAWGVPSPARPPRGAPSAPRALARPRALWDSSGRGAEEGQGPRLERPRAFQARPNTGA